jgi:hypothetical protein
LHTFLGKHSTVKALIFLGVLASLFSFAKFDHCRNTNWGSPDSYVHACYSDIPVLFTERAMDVHQWAFKGGEKAVEYPVITGAVMWATSFISSGGPGSNRNYFDVNAILIALLFIGSLLVMWKISPRYGYLLALSPAVLASLYINWDLWGIFTMLLAIYCFDRERFTWSAVLFGISIATKFFPVFLFLPILLIFWRRGEIRSLIKFTAVAGATWLAVNLPVILTTPAGWWHFYKLNLDRGPDWGSLWYGLSLLGVNVGHLNYISILALLAVLTAITLLLLEISYPPSLAQISFIVLAAILCVGKVYSPQYVLWLAPLAVIALRGKSQLASFWIWQAGEAIYHVAIWQHLASVQGSHFGLPGTGYALASILRILTTVFFIGTLVQGLHQNPPPQAQASRSRLADFLFGSATSYP